MHQVPGTYQYQRWLGDCYYGPLVAWFGSANPACKEKVTSPFHGKSFFGTPNYTKLISWWDVLGRKSFSHLKMVGWRATSHLFDFRHAKALQDDYPPDVPHWRWIQSNRLRWISTESSFFHFFSMSGSQGSLVAKAPEIGCFVACHVTPLIHSEKKAS